MNDQDRATARRVRARLEGGARDAASLRAALGALAPLDRDAWLDLVLGSGSPPDDGPELPRGGVPYLPCPVDALVRAIDAAAIGPADVFVDVGAGVGRAAAVVNLLTGAEVVGVEVQPALVAAARALAARLRLARVSFIEGDAADLPPPARAGSVFFLYCPFSGERLTRLLGHLEALARTREVRVCCVDLPLPSRPWLEPLLRTARDLQVFRSQDLSVARLRIVRRRLGSR